jgi:hypothetical protein
MSVYTIISTTWGKTRADICKTAAEPLLTELDERRLAIIEKTLAISCRVMLKWWKIT